MRKKALAASLLLILSILFTVNTGAQSLSRLVSGIGKAVSSMTLTDAQVANYVHEYIVYSDKENQVLPASDPYSQRLARITQGLTEVDGIPLNFAVYKSNEVNAFACADGSVRVYTALMDLMEDDEVLGVIGHEIGHVAHHDSRNQFKKILMSEAVRDGLASTSGRLAALTDSQLAAVGQQLVNAKFSRKQEQNADDYGYEFLKAHGKNPGYMALAFAKLQQVEQQSGAQSNALAQLFSSHPDVQKRIDRVVKKARKEGYMK